MLAGTGEGPLLAARLLAKGWRLRVSVVSASATAAYRQLLDAAAPGQLELWAAALDGPVELAAGLAKARCDADPFALVIDATHPFAVRITANARCACQQQQVPLWRLLRPHLAGGEPWISVLPSLTALASLDLAAARVLFALGSRHLAAAMQHSPGAFHHARVLPNPQALQLALAAGLDPQRLACLQPSRDFAVEAALVRRWRITTIVCRQSGGLIEQGWRRLAQGAGCRLLLLARPDEPGDVTLLSLPELLAKLEIPGSDGHG